MTAFLKRYTPTISAAAIIISVMITVLTLVRTADLDNLRSKDVEVDGRLDMEISERKDLATEVQRLRDEMTEIRIRLNDLESKRRIR